MQAAIRLFVETYQFKLSCTEVERHLPYNKCLLKTAILSSKTKVAKFQLNCYSLRC